MKKIILSICTVALGIGLVACGDKAQSNSNASERDIQLGDSMATAYGEFMGATSRTNIDRQLASMSEDQKKNFSNADFLRGVKAVASRDTADLAYLMGVQAGMQLWGAAKGMPEQFNVPVDAQEMVKAFEKVFNADSIADSYSYQMNFQQIMSAVQAYAQEKENARLESLPEVIENKAKGAAYADSLVNNAGYTRAESGLVYIIENPGTGDLVKANDRIKLNYKGMHIDGSVFDQTREEPMTSYAGRFIPGFTEGLQLLGKGGKATLVIPGELAYGLQGQGETIGRDETLVFEIEIVDIL
ncbi:MAG: FKBP-type peptidyl-prolyl cis-trans isomerase [Clostridiales bacterium]|nr:FKBP-type peptidyl-prolyl cis-trans isomerase [Clostridiales bacterium]